ncbi:MAG: hypothetical protein IT495_15710 [Gammaproteobacteria bacterium]|nr:hypothetical protein [Gammaproteobacteria bacterium]
MNTAQSLRLERVNAHVHRVVHPRLGHVGNLKLAGGAWKFKAVGYDDRGVVPGGGPYTDAHNTVVHAPDAAALTDALGPHPGA